MSIFIGSKAGDTITTELVSAGVTVIGGARHTTAASDLILAGNGNDVVAAGGGDDLVFLGGGNDTFIWRSGDGNDIVDGGSGADRLQFNGSAAAENITISAGILGSAQVVRNVGNVNTNLIGVERIEIAALDGQDRITVNDLAHTDVQQVAVNLAGAANPNAGDGQADMVVVNGSQAAEQINLSANGTSVVISGLVATTTVDHMDAGLDRIVINANGGDDVVTASNGLASLVQLTIDGGAGNDTITGGDGADQLIGGDGNDAINGGRGNDVALLGAGNDGFTWNPGDGSDVVEGGTGTDTLVFNGANVSEHIDISANGERARFFRDVANVAMDLNDVERIHFNALGGADEIAIHDLSGTDVTQVEVDLAAAASTSGDGQVDRVIAEGRNTAESIQVVASGGLVQVAGLKAAISIEHAEATDQLVVAGLGGDDTISGANLPDGLIALTLDGGAGNDTLIGSAGADVLLGGDGNDVLKGGAGNDQMSGDAGNDRLVWNAGDGSDVVEGGVDTDTLEVNGTNGADTFTITANGTRERVDSLDAAPSNLDVGTVEKIVINANGGDDVISAGNGLAALVQLTIDGGAGNDTITGGDGVDLLIGGAGNDLVNGGRGNDTTQLGAGDDTFVWNPGDGNDVVEGQAGTDTLKFNGANVSENVDISANGSRASFHRDVANITMDLNGVERIDFAALGGADNIAIGDMTGSGVQQIHVDLGAIGGTDDGAADVVSVGFTTGDDAIDFNVQAGPAIINSLGGTQVFVDHQGVGDRFAIDGGAGNDSVTAHGTGGDDVIGLAFDGTGVAVFAAGGQAISVTNVEQLLVEGGAGNDTIVGQNGIAALTHLTIDGGAGDDTITGGDGADQLIGGEGNDVVNGGRGNDVAMLGAGDDSFTWNPGDGSDIVEGNAGTDTLQFNGSNASEDMVLSASGSEALLTRNVGAITMDLHGMETVNIAALGGVDNITIGDLTGSDVKQVNLDLGAIGGAPDSQLDNVVINGTDGSDVITLSMRDGALVVGGLAEEVVIKNFDPNDGIHIAGLGGDDVIDASALGAGGPQIILDGGEGDDVLVGGAGNDILLGAAGDDVLLGGGGVDVIDGGPGDNILIQDLVAPEPNAPAAQGDIFALGQVTIEDFQGGSDGAAAQGAANDTHGIAGAPDFAVEDQMASAHIDGASSHADGYLL